jgi:hypothetical protein
LKNKRLPSEEVRWKIDSIVCRAAKSAVSGLFNPRDQQNGNEKVVCRNGIRFRYRAYYHYDIYKEH